MAARSVWKGYVRFSLVSIPCKAYTAAVAGGEGQLALNQLHKGCGARIKHQKVCPVHGEVTNDEIISGYQFAKGQYVTVDPDELAKIRTQSDKTLGIEAFIPKDKIDERYFTGRSLYLVPDGPIGKKPYAMLLHLMDEEKKVAFTTGVFQNRDQIMLLRPVDGLICASFLNYEAEVRPASEFLPEVPSVELEKKELDLARMLVDQLTEKKFDFGKYKDQYAANLEKLVQAKVEGKEVIAPPAEEEPQVINLMEALQRSLSEAKSKSGAAPKPVAAKARTHAKPARITAPSTAVRVAANARHKRRSS